MNLGTALRNARKAKGLTQPRLAAVSGVDAQTISRIERGRTREPHGPTLTRLEEALEVKLPRPPPGAPPPNTEERLDQIEAAVLELKEQIDARPGGARAGQLQTGGDATAEAMEVFELLRRRREGRRRQ